MKYGLSVFIPLDPRHLPAAHVVHVFGVEVDKPLAWMRDHADELAAKLVPGVPYNALMVEARP